MIQILGRFYSAVSADNMHWLIKRGKFEMGRFIGTPEEVTTELTKWDDTVKFTNGAIYS